MDVSEYLWNMYNEHTSQGRHHETQRTAVSTVVLALAGAVVAVIAQGHFRHTWSLAAFLILLGLVGSLFSLKQAERTRMHITIAGEFRRQLEQSLANQGSTASTQGEIANNLKFIGGNARQKHQEEWNWKTGKDDKKAREQAGSTIPAVLVLYCAQPPCFDTWYCNLGHRPLAYRDEKCDFFELGRPAGPAHKPCRARSVFRTVS